MQLNKEKLFIGLLLNDAYINWLNKFKEIDTDSYWETEMNSNDIIMLELLEYLFSEVRYNYIRCYPGHNYECFCLKYVNDYYVLKSDGKWFSCKHYDKPLYLNINEDAYRNIKLFESDKEFPTLEYELIKERHKNFYFNLNQEEKINITKAFETLGIKNCANCTNENCNRQNYGQIVISDNGKLEGSNCHFWYNENLIDKAKVFKK